jgi:hypothetical protein
MGACDTGIRDLEFRRPGDASAAQYPAMRNFASFILVHFSSEFASRDGVRTC